VIVTPHISAASQHFLRRQVDICKENLARYLRGEQLANLVTRERGY
jgi:phosphoglycerate dehydrogenase-like enzyme